MYIYSNKNPDGKHVGDCVIRAIAEAMDISWEEAYLWVAVWGLMLHDMPSSNNIWGSYLRSRGFRREVIPNTCPDCYTVSDFTRDNPIGIYILATGTHVIACKDGDYYDTWDSGDEVPIYLWRKL